MFISVHKNVLRQVWLHLVFTAFFAVFGAVYEKFSHGVFSFAMVYAFGIPLMLGAVPYLSLSADKVQPDAFHCHLWNAGVLTLTVGAAFKGVLDIYGTTNALIYVYPAAGIILLAAGAALYFRKLRNAEKAAS